MTAIVKHDDLAGDKIDLLTRTICKGATRDELSLFVATANRLRLDPFARQIFAVKRWDSGIGGMVMQSQVSIDGQRLVAERTGEYLGQTRPEWCGKDGVWKDVWLSEEPPSAARCGVHRRGFAEPLVRVARYASYVQTTKDRKTDVTRPNAMWAKMPDVMLAKCAESLALRAAFPNELSGVYTPEEMGSDIPEAQIIPAPPEPSAPVPAPLPDPEARFPETWRGDGGMHAGKLMSDANGRVLGAFIVDCERILARADITENARVACGLRKQQAEAEIDAMMLREAEKAANGERRIETDQEVMNAWDPETGEVHKAEVVGSADRAKADLSAKLDLISQGFDATDHNEAWGMPKP